MALSNADRSGGAGNVPQVANTTVRGTWRTLHGDGEATAVSLGSGISLYNQTQDGARWVRVPSGAARLFLRGKSSAGATPTTSPSVAIGLHFGEIPDGDNFPTQGTGTPAIPHTGIACSLTKESDDADGTASAVYDYGPMVTNGGEGYDLYGASWVLVLVTTQGDTTAAETIIEGLFLN